MDCSRSTETRWILWRAQSMKLEDGQATIESALLLPINSMADTHSSPNARMTWDFRRSIRLMDTTAAIYFRVMLYCCRLNACKLLKNADGRLKNHNLDVRRLSVRTCIVPPPNMRTWNLQNVGLKKLNPSVGKQLVARSRW